LGAKQGANIITGMITFGERKFRRTLEKFNRHANIYYIAELKHSETSKFRNTAVMNIRKYQIYIPGLYSWAVGIKVCFSDDKIQKEEMPSKYVMEIYSKRHSIPLGITN
jgi:hypothetical protein